MLRVGVRTRITLQSHYVPISSSNSGSLTHKFTTVRRWQSQGPSSKKPLQKADTDDWLGHAADCSCGSHSHSHNDQGVQDVMKQLMAQSGLKPAESHSHSHEHKHDHKESHGLFGGHSHSHGSENVDLLMKSGGLRDPRVRITWIGLLANVGLAVGKGIGGVVFHSQSLIADSMHAVTDMISDFLTLSTVSVARRRATRLWPNGYGRIEAIGTFGVSSLLLAAGASMGWGSFVTVLETLGSGLPDWLHGIGSHSHSHGHELADWNAAWIALASIVIKESLFQATNRIGQRTNSQVLVANAWHHRIDSLASAVAVVSIVGGQLLNAAWLDPLGGLIVSGMILRAGWQPSRDSALEIAGYTKRAMDSPTFDEVKQRAEMVLKSVAPGIKLVDVILEPYGSTFVATIQISGIEKGDEFVAKTLRREILQIQHLKECRITLA